jgi:hypothetical protein
MEAIGHSAGRRALRRALAQSLSQLGDSPEAVAQRLTSYGVRGRPGHADDCALARFCHVLVASEPSVSGTAVLARYVKLSRPGLRPPLFIPLTEALRAFVTGFDQGRYPDLVHDRPSPERRLPNA